MAEHVHTIYKGSSSSVSVVCWGGVLPISKEIHNKCFIVFHFE